MRKPPTSRGRQVSFRTGVKTEQSSALTRMKTKIDSDEGRHIYSQRLGTVEPVFGNITVNKKMDRFGHRGKSKVNAQWLMFCMVQNIEKLQRYEQTG